MEIFARLQQHLLPLAVDFLRLCVWLGLLMAVFVPLERVFALRSQPVIRKGFSRDLGWYFLGGLVPALLLVPLMGAIGWVLHFVVGSTLQTHVGAMPLALRFAASLAVGELGFYWGHRWSHEIPLLWRFHAIHHSAEEMDWLVNTRAHAVDLAFTRLCGFIPLYALGLVQPVTATSDAVPLLVILTGTVWGFFVHANLNWRLGPLEWLIATPAYHHWHHTYEGPLNRNFAPMLPWVDRLFGTYHAPKTQWPSRYGTDTPMAPSLAGQLLQPFMPSSTVRQHRHGRDVPQDSGVSPSQGRPDGDPPLCRVDIEQYPGNPLATQRPKA
jgi:sterol desaturase/sphingolipid hydroxylase (fatty acid hydroxylase superfamily)